MMDYASFDVAAFKWGAANRAAQMLGIAEAFLHTSEPLERIQCRDPKAADLLTRFFAAYDNWYDLSARRIEDDDRKRHQAELLDKIAALDNTRQALIAHLTKL
jgi:hypothetical protein